jgi:uncharacterized protein (DUF2147 family)
MKTLSTTMKYESSITKPQINKQYTYAGILQTHKIMMKGSLHSQK